MKIGAGAGVAVRTMHILFTIKSNAHNIHAGVVEALLFSVLEEWLWLA